MPKSRGSRESFSRSISRSPLASPTEEVADPLSRSSSAVAFVTLGIENFAVSQESRRAVRVQAAKASAAARKRTIALRKAERKGSSPLDEAGSSSATGSDRGRSPSSQTLSPTQNSFGDANFVKSERGRSPSSQTLSPTQFSFSDSKFVWSARSPSRSPGRSPSSAQFEAFRTYPVTEWHPLIPDLVEHFFKYFAPEATADSRGREVLRTQLWPEALTSPALFHAILLTVGSHSAASRALQIPRQLLAQFKHATLEHINEAVARAEVREGIDDNVVAAIALLGGWELDYGNPETYVTHMRGLETIVSLRGGLYGRSSPRHGQKSLLPAITSLILNAGHDQALYASKDPYFSDQELPMSPRAALPAGFETLRVQRLLLPSLIQTVSRLGSQNPKDPRSLARLEDVARTLGQWDLAGATRSSFCPSQTELDDIIQLQASLHVRLAGLALCALLQMASGIDVQGALPNIYEEVQQHRPELLVHTVYAEVLFWSLMITCAATGLCEPRHMRVLKRLQGVMGIESWPAAVELLSRYVYPTDILESRAYALWKAISFSIIARDAVSNLREPTKFARDIQHPMTWLGLEVAAEEH